MAEVEVEEEEMMIENPLNTTELIPAEIQQKQSLPRMQIDLLIIDD